MLSTTVAASRAALYTVISSIDPTNPSPARWPTLNVPRPSPSMLLSGRECVVNAVALEGTASRVAAFSATAPAPLTYSTPSLCSPMVTAT